MRGAAFAGALLALAAAAVPARAWSDHPVDRGAPVRSLHITELRVAVDGKRETCGLGAFPWATDAAIGRPARAAVFNELRTAVRDLYVVLGATTPPVFTPPDPLNPGDPLRYVYLNELRGAVDAVLPFACPVPACVCGAWANGACGAAGGCPAGQRQQTRGCAPANCNAQSRCVADVSCGSPPECVRDADCNSGCECGCMIRERCSGGNCVIASSYCCFDPAAKVDTPSGPRPIGELSRDDAVYSMDPKTRRLVTAKVEGARRKESDRKLELTFADGRTLVVTPEHPFFDPDAGDYRRVDDFKPGDKMLALDGKEGAPLRLERVRELPGGPVISLTVDGFNNFFSNGVLVHNKCAMNTGSCAGGP